jgi:hypothetical protein
MLPNWRGEKGKTKQKEEGRESDSEADERTTKEKIKPTLTEVCEKTSLRCPG